MISENKLIHHIPNGTNTVTLLFGCVESEGIGIGEIKTSSNRARLLLIICFYPSRVKIKQWKIETIIQQQKDGFLDVG